MLTKANREGSVASEIRSAVKRVPPTLRSLRFPPWIGRYYRTGGILSTRVLVLGESHYDYDKRIKRLPATLTCQCIAEQVTALHYAYSHWTKIARTLVGECADLAGRQRLWNSVAVYTYVQESVGNAPRIRPSADMWPRWSTAFFQVLATLRPSLVLVFGKQLWEGLPEAVDTERKLRISGVDLEECYYRPARGVSVRAVMLRHPSGGLSPQSCYPALKTLLSQD